MTKVFSIGPVVISLGWARSYTWATTKPGEQRVYLVSLHVTRKPLASAGNAHATLLNLILGPASLIIGFSRANPVCDPTS